VLRETTEDRMSESRFGSNAGVEGDETSYDADVRANSDVDLDDGPDPQVSYNPDEPQTSREADEAAAYDDSGVDADSTFDDDDVVDSDVPRD
jgi:hypothetical protein